MHIFSISIEVFQALGDKDQHCYHLYHQILHIGKQSNLVRVSSIFAFFILNSFSSSIFSQIISSLVVCRSGVLIIHSNKTQFFQPKVVILNVDSDVDTSSSRSINLLGKISRLHFYPREFSSSTSITSWSCQSKQHFSNN